MPKKIEVITPKKDEELLDVVEVLLRHSSKELQCDLRWMKENNCFYTELEVMSKAIILLREKGVLKDPKPTAPMLSNEEKQRQVLQRLNEEVTNDA